ncbi:MAG: PorP/SprF family type IX secretion system membrane protein, partial [Flavobacteriaceae bacterium]
DKMTKRPIVYLALLFLPLLSFGQQESYYSFYRNTMNIINPAFAGAEEGTVFSFTSRRQWSFDEEAPNTLAFSYSSVRANKLGLGISLVADRVFIEQQTNATIDFSYQLNMETTQVYLGLKAGGNFYKADPTGLLGFAASPDPIQQAFSKFNPNIGVGALLKRENLWLSFSLPRIFKSNRTKDLAITAKDRVHTYLGGGATLPLGTNLYLKPSILLRKVKGLPLSTDLTGFISWQQKFDAGMSYRSSGAFSILSSVRVGNFDLGYAYETPILSGLAQLNLKTHEVFLRIHLGAKATEAAKDTVIEEEE